jgi:hypothetical protein
MIGSAQEHATLADTAIATPTVVEHVHAGPLKGVNEALAATVTIWPVEWSSTSKALSAAAAGSALKSS